ncbi:uncharacterized protein LOC144148704 [Haemaphysalis longicornis]
MMASAERQFRRRRNQRTEACLSLVNYPGAEIVSAVLGEQCETRQPAVSDNGSDTSQEDEERVPATRESASECLDSPQPHNFQCSGAGSRYSSGFVHSDIREREEMSEAEGDTGSFRSRLQTLAIEHGLSHSSVTALLGLLRTHGCFSSLPRSARTLLATPRRSQGILHIAGGKYCHFGIEEGVRDVLRLAKALPQELALNFNIDGLPIAKSSGSHFWTILGQVKDIDPHSPFVVGVFFGYEKPDNGNEFLRLFVNDLKTVTTAGIQVGALTIPVRLNALICDAPAKAFILNIRGHTGYYSCTKCTVKGTYKKGRVCFPDISKRLRSDASFRDQVQVWHHHGTTILEELRIDLVQDVPLDYMHLVCLGVMRKLLKLWVRGPKESRQEIDMREELSVKLSKLAMFVPAEFNRRPRSLLELDRWKATEFRFFLLYGGPLVLSSILKGVVPPNFKSVKSLL